jgi:hypothetical protein
MKKMTGIVVCLVLLGVVPARAADPVSGKWEGTATNDFGPVRFTAELREGQDGSLTGKATIPDQMLYDLDVTGSVKDGTLTMVVALPDAPVECEGRQGDDGAISGAYTQFGQAGTFTMTRVPAE